ncbi:hypothetical protein IU501_29000 [Nocardia otitidiscaviarum]|uniref:hypothetical protein n=1 Tax=Nocardia otitidiscaviarum TaxID=1823 RepID=UPI0004A6AC20|nr:hypothetical protein [Nocardia otitidiscaviarum]MBF6137023.1 hypothetical protein [Nocardia otitidiscaviarum]MBF6485223.1 hypothetical protein [Nocardia otitidiscaviarum]
MTTADTDGSALRLLSTILTHFDSLDAFLAQLHHELDGPTQILPRIDPDTVPAPQPSRPPIPRISIGGTGRHARRDTRPPSRWQT